MSLISNLEEEIDNLKQALADQQREHEAALQQAAARESRLQAVLQPFVDEWGKLPLWMRNAALDADVTLEGKSLKVRDALYFKNACDALAEPPSAALEKLRSEHEARVAGLVEACKPFADAVANENGNPESGYYGDHVTDADFERLAAALADSAPLLAKVVERAKAEEYEWLFALLQRVITSWHLAGDPTKWTAAHHLTQLLDKLRAEAGKAEG